MKTLRNFFMVFALVVATGAMIACEEEEPTSINNSDDCYDELVALAEILNEKSNIFSNNPTSSTCSAMRTAALNLIQAAQDCDEYGYMYEDAAQAWLDVDCSAFD